MSCVATIGFFDGVHRGHQFLLDCLLKEASPRGLSSAVLTFEEHPDLVLRGIRTPLLTTFDERRQRLLDKGVGQVLPFRFADIHTLKAEQFLRLIHDHYQVQVLLMGYDHRFGSDNLGSFDQYQRVAQKVGVELVLIPQAPDITVSSTRIREALLQGDVETANDLLGYDYTLTGTVVHGNAIGRTIGFPTANLSLPADKLIPASGVYAVTAQITNQKSSIFNFQFSISLLNIGKNPTLGPNPLSVELHIPDFDGDLYDQTLSVSLLRRIRPEQTFPSLDALRTQILHDLHSL